MKILKGFIIVLMLSIVVYACDKIEKPYIIEVPETGNCVEPEFAVITDYSQNVYLEEYTGHECVNCPTGAVLAHGIQLESNGRLIITSIHAGVFAEPKEAPFDLDLTSEVGDELNEFFQIPANPFAVINRVPNGAFWGGFLPQWDAMIQTQMDIEPKLGIQLMTNYIADSNRYCIHVRSELLEASSQNMSLVILVQESGIEGTQKNSDPEVGTVPEIEDYEFEHVLRGTVTSVWGIRAYTTGDPDGTVYKASFTYELNENWVADNCTIVAYIYDEESKQVLNVEEIHFPETE